MYYVPDWRWEWSKGRMWKCFAYFYICHICFINFCFILVFNGPRTTCQWTKKIPEILEENSRTRLQVTRFVELLKAKSKAGQFALMLSHISILQSLSAFFVMQSLPFKGPQCHPYPPCSAPLRLARLKQPQRNSLFPSKFLCSGPTF